MSSGAVLYVYYKVDPTDHAALAPRVRAFQAALRAQHPGLQTELLQRPDTNKGVETWMETYRQDAGLPPGTAAAIEQSAIEAGLPGPRFAEAFIPLR